MDGRGGLQKTLDESLFLRFQRVSLALGRIMEGQGTSERKMAMGSSTVLSGGFQLPAGLNLGVVLRQFGAALFINDDCF